MSSTSPSSESSLQLSPHEFANFIVEPENAHALVNVFSQPHDSNCLTLLRYYLFTAQSTHRMEQELERHRTEQANILDRLCEATHFPLRAKPLLDDYRRKTRRYRFHPYSQTPSPNLFPINSYELPPIDVEIKEEGPQKSLSSYRATYNEEPGSKENPIYILGEDECAGCHEDGHRIGDCEREYRWNGMEYAPIPIDENPMEPIYVIDTDYYHSNKNNRN
jgi:hypothetical protein